MQVTFNTLPTYANYVLVDGSFDPLHAGHVAYINAARALHKGPLLCAVASDDQIRAKGREPLLPQASRVAVMEALCDAVYAKDRPTEQVIEKMCPRAYVKGADWEDRLPPEQVSACGRVGTSLVFVNVPIDSSTARLRAWALRDAEQSLDRLTARMATQEDYGLSHFDLEYFKGAWRTDSGPYTMENRRIQEGKHPDILAEVFKGWSVLDVGCGPGFLMALLRERGMNVWGCDPSMFRLKDGAPELIRDRFLPTSVVSDYRADLVICREVLEHVKVQRIPGLIRDMFTAAQKAVYITTRFHQGSIFDVTDERQVDPTHQSVLTQPFLRSLCVLHGGRRNRELEAKLDHMGKGRVLVYDV